MQEWIAFALGAAAAAYLISRVVRRRGSGNCCGEKTCPAAEQLARKLQRLS